MAKLYQVQYQSICILLDLFAPGDEAREEIDLIKCMEWTNIHWKIPKWKD